MTLMDYSIMLQSLRDELRWYETKMKENSKNIGIVNIVLALKQSISGLETICQIYGI